MAQRKPLVLDPVTGRVQQLPISDSLDAASRVTLGDSNSAIVGTPSLAAITTALTAARTYTLPAANTYAAGSRLLIVDQTGTLTSVITATIARNGTDTINGVLITVVFNRPFDYVELVSNGVNGWLVVRLKTASFGQTFLAREGIAPSANLASFDTRASSLNTVDVVLDFDGATDESISFISNRTVENYTGKGITVTSLCLMSSAISGSVVLAGAFRRIRAGEAVTRSFSAVQSSVATAVPAINGNYFEVTISFGSNDINDLKNGDLFALLLSRDADNAADNAAGDLELVAVFLKETGT